MSNNLLLGNIYELHPTQMTQFAKGSFHLKKTTKQDGAASESSSSRLGHQTWDMGNRNLEILKRSYFQRQQNKAQAFPQYWNFFKIFK